MNSLRKLRFFFAKKSPIYKFLDYLPLGSAVLDVGCGSCLTLGNLKELRPDIRFYGIDVIFSISCEKFLKEFKVVNIEYEHIPYTDQYFDGIIMCHILEHLKDTTLLKKEIHRLLKKDGIIFVAAPSSITVNFPKKNILKKFGIPVSTLNFYDDITHIGRPYDPKDLITWLPAAFEILSSGRIRNPYKKIILPIKIVGGIVIRNPDYVSSALWELFGAVSYTTAKNRTGKIDR
jgi:SAM-dependent methyltransferase